MESKNMKVVLIGAGSYVFATTVLRDTLEKHRYEDELVLVDINKDVADLMAAVGRKMAGDLGLKTKITSSNDRTASLPGADFVLLSASPDGQKRWRMDFEILARYNMANQARECGGLGGLSNALRGINMAMTIARDMEKLCPNAILLDVSNPMPRLVTAVNQYSSIKCYGFCNIAWRSGYGYLWVAETTDRELKNIHAVSAGLNHFAWLVSASDFTNGDNLYPIIKNTIKRRHDREATVMQGWLREYGGIVMGAIDHHAEYLPFQPEIKYNTTPPFHGDAVERERQWDLLRGIAVNAVDWKTQYPMESWEHPIDFAMAIAFKKNATFDIVNLPNDGHIINYPNGPVVEVPVKIINGKIEKYPEIKLPGKTTDLCIKVSAVHDMVAKGAATGNLAALREAIEIDMSIDNKEVAQDVLDKFLLAHEDLLPKFN
jgi:alpha-galactosidase